MLLLLLLLTRSAAINSTISRQRKRPLRRRHQVQARKDESIQAIDYKNYRKEPKDAIDIHDCPSNCIMDGVMSAQVAISSSTSSSALHSSSRTHGIPPPWTHTTQRPCSASTDSMTRQARVFVEYDAGSGNGMLDGLGLFTFVKDLYQSIQSCPLTAKDYAKAGGEIMACIRTFMHRIYATSPLLLGRASRKSTRL